MPAPDPATIAASWPARTHAPAGAFWPYVENPEEPTAEELAALDPDLHAALFGPRDLPFSITLVFGPFDGDDYARAVRWRRPRRSTAKSATGDELRHRARFFPGDALRMRDLFELVGAAADPRC